MKSKPSDRAIVVTKFDGIHHLIDLPDELLRSKPVEIEFVYRNINRSAELEFAERRVLGKLPMAVALPSGALIISVRLSSSAGEVSDLGEPQVCDYGGQHVRFTVVTSSGEPDPEKGEVIDGLLEKYAVRFRLTGVEAERPGVFVCDAALLNYNPIIRVTEGKALRIIGDPRSFVVEGASWPYREAEHPTLDLGVMDLPKTPSVLLIPAAESETPVTDRMSGEVKAAVESARVEAFERAAQRVRNYLKHRRQPAAYDRQTEFQKGVCITCKNLEKIMLEEAGLTRS